MEIPKRIRLVVHGRVQGVFFRDSARKLASELELTGFVRNLPDGSVEMVAEGPAPALRSLEEWAQHGPPRARVDRVEREEGEARDEFSDFHFRF